MITYRYANGQTKIEMNGITMRVTSDTIKPKGYEHWTAVRYMTTDADRLHCAAWVVGLIRRGILKSI
jgi:hypothetical protein